MIIRWLSRLAAAAAIFALTGCATPELFKFAKDDFPKAGPKNPVIRILGLWEPAKGMLKNKTTRGFSSQILFFSQKSDVAAQVDGDVVIYVFDDQGTSEEQARPFEHYKIDETAWKGHMGKGPLGATYGVFVPYTRPGIHEAKCALRIRYTPQGGQPVYSEMVNVVLPGKKKPKETATPDADADDSASQGTETEDEAFGEFRRNILNRQPPQARGAATTIPTPQEIQEQTHARQKIPAAELTAKERRRIMREATARLESGKDANHVAHAGYEEPEPDVAATEEDSADEVSVGAAHKPRAHVVETLDENDDEAPAAVEPQAQPAKRHVLDDDE